MAQAVEEGVDVRRKEVQDVSVEEFLDYGGIILGSPTCYGTMAGGDQAPLGRERHIPRESGRRLLLLGDRGRGNETTVLDILKALLVHGMIIQGSPMGPHYGPVALGGPGACINLGKSVAQLVKKLT